MQVLSLIPFVAVLVAAAFVAVSLAWSSAERSTRSMTGIFVSTGLWALFDLSSQLQSDPVQAVFWIKMINLPMLALGILGSRLLVDLVPELAGRMQRPIRVGTFAAVLMGVASVWMPGVIDGATPTEWGGWMPHYGVVSFGLIPVACSLPGYAAYQAWRNAPPRAAKLDRARSHAVGAVVVGTVTVALSTEVLLPILQIPFPRLAALVSTLATASMWLRVVHLREGLALTPQGIAREVLSDLYDGVALVDADGTILSSNSRLASMVGLRATKLAGMPLSERVDVSMEAIRIGLADREFGLETASGGRVPVSISSSCVRDVSGDGDWFVVIFRDLRNVDALRRRLLTSGRLAAIGELAAGIAHEVNNPVAFIRSDLNFLKNRLDEIHGQYAKEFVSAENKGLFEDGSARIDRALDGVERVAEVVGDVMSFAHVASGPGSARDLAPVLEGAIRLARLERREAVQLQVAQADLGVSVASGQELKQVLLALMRVLTVGSRAGSTVTIDLEREGASLRIHMRAGSMIAPAREAAERFERAREDALEASPADLGLAIAIELADQLGGSTFAEPESEHALRIEVSWPVEEHEEP